MTTAVQHRRGTTAEHSTFTGLEGEVTIDTTKDTAVIHDGVLAGGYPLAKETLANVNPSSLTAITGAATASDDLFMVYDASTTSMKKITRAELNNAMEADALANVSITGGTINGTTIGGTTAAAGSFTTLSASDAVTLSAGTANGVAYLNGSKVLTSGSALTFDGTNLGVAGSVKIPQGYALEGRNQANSGTGVWFGVAGRVDFGIGGDYAIIGSTSGTIWGNSATNTEQMRLTSTGLDVKGKFGVGYSDFSGLPTNGAAFAGSVGIGTSSPSAKLHVYDNINGTSVAWGNVSRTGYLYQDANGVGVTNASGTSFDEGVYLDSANSKVVLYTNSTGRATLDSSGNLGLGVTPSAWSPQKAMQIATYTALADNPQGGGGFGLSSNAYEYSSGAYKYLQNYYATLYRTYAGQHQWFTAPSGTAGNAISFTQAMTLDASGKLLLGTSAATAGTRLEIADSSDNAFTAVLWGADKSTEYFAFGVAGAGESRITAGGAGTTSNAITFHTAASGVEAERARIDSSGNLLVGKTSSSANGDGAQLFPSGTVGLGHTSGTVTGTAYAAFGYAGGGIGSITQSGTTGVSYNTSSDYRLKDNIQDITGSGAFIDALQPRTWNWKVDGSVGAGFIAHELQAVSPSSVVGEKDAVDADGNPEYQAVEYGSAEVIAMLVAEVKSLRARLTAAGL